jgi:uncharacterized heparinase superfamily protein
MLHRLKRYLLDLLHKNRQRKQIHVREFRRLAREMTLLADIAVKISPGQEDTMAGLQKIRQEMDRLSKLVDSRDFSRIHPRARLELRENLLTSREQLIQTIHQAPPPTSTLQ